MDKPKEQPRKLSPKPKPRYLQGVAAKPEKKLSQEEIVKSLKLQIQKQKQELDFREGEIQKLTRFNEDKRDKIAELHQELEEEKKSRIENEEGLRKQYNDLQKTFQQRISHLESQMTEMRTQNEKDMKVQRERVENAEKEIKEKEKTIKEQSTSLENITREFGDLLNEAIRKMNDKMDGRNYATLKHTANSPKSPKNKKVFDYEGDFM
eukprot:TRINITY_DN5651_c0_g1_i2.p1 TRINITY_DN5651_c0_g1~~TRINITY_DN5651_c0_g1_i2.p1  ORF type:complete len:208 (-),score=55.17 TRINITY_DN5651_c0_g1_i2:52-675(-)